MNDARLQVAFGGLHPDRIRSLYEEFGPEGTLRRIARGRITTTDRARAAVSVPAGERREQLRVAGIDVVYRGGAQYPEHLAGMPDAPDLLFVRGSLPAEAAVAIVGTRRCTSYGKAIARDYGSAIARCGWPLVSGLARGIDGAAHRGTVAGAGIGIAVLGSGIDVMYPREHADLARNLIAAGGAIVSESPPGTPPEAWRFPPRNRIISGLAAAVVVVEATVKGGALITAEAALRHGKQVFAVPGDIGRASSVGCNLLIRDGAFPVHDPDDMVESLELLLGPARQPAADPDGAALASGDRELLDLVASGVGEVDEIITRCGRQPGEVLAALGRLEISGALRCETPGRYSIAGPTPPGR